MSWQQVHIQAAAAYLRDQIAAGATDAKTRSIYEGLLEVLDPNRRATRLRRELAESTKVVPIQANRERRGRPDRRASTDRRRVNLGPRAAWSEGPARIAAPAATAGTSSLMPHTNPPDDQLRQLLTSAKTIAIVGVSSNPERPSYGIMKRLQKAGYKVIPVNPRETDVLGERSYPSLVDVPERIDIVDVFRRAEDTPPIADEAITIGAKALWLQTGITNEDAAARASAAGLTVVMNACIGNTHARLKI